LKPVVLGEKAEQIGAERENTDVGKDLETDSIVLHVASGEIYPSIANQC
jgi:hypothetical protein